MATSLARQLTALRTPAASSAVRTEVYSGPFLIQEAEQDVCDPAKLRICVTESLAELTKLDNEFERIGDILLEEGVDVDNVTEVVEDALLLVSPYCLLKPAQWVLQWLVTKFQVHYKHPDMFFLCVLPVYDYDIYRRAIEAIVTTPGGASKFPNWFPQFKQCCFPTTKLGLHRHCASDRGFFKLLCELMLKLNQHVTKYPKSKIQRACTMFIMTILGALENCGNVGEQQLHNLLQVVLAGFKAEHSEFNSLSNILLSYILPRVTLNSKAASKITKVIGKTLKKGESEESLFLIILMTRTQPNVDQSKMIGLIIKHEAVINSELNKAKLDDSEDVKDLADNVIYTLSLLLNTIIPLKGETLVDVTCDQCSLLSLLKDALSTAPELSSITASNLASTMADFHAALPKHQEVLLDTINQAKSSVKKIISLVEKRYPEEYQEAFAGSGHTDILFIGGGDGTDPSEKQVSVKRSLQDNELVNFLMQDYLITQTKVRTKEVSKIVRKNSDSIQKVLEAEPSFLISQVEPEKLDRLLINLVKILPSQPEFQALAVKLLCCEEISKIIQDSSVLELSLLPLLFISGDNQTAKNLLSSHFATVSPILSLVTSLRLLVAGKDAKGYNKEVLSKLAIVLPLDVVDKILGSKVTKSDPQLITLVLLILASKMEKSNASEESKVASRLIVWTLNNLAVASVGEEKAPEDLVIVARETGSVPSIVVFDAVGKLEDHSEEKTICSDLFSVLPSLIEREMADAGEVIKKVIRKNIPDNEKFLSFLVKNAFSAKCMKTSYLSLIEAEKLVDDSGIVIKILKKDGNNTAITYILAVVLSGATRIQKAAFSILAKIAKATSKKSALLPLVTFFVDNKSAIINDVGNIDEILKKEPLEDDVVGELLLKCLKGDVQIFSKLSPIFASLSSKKDMSTICKYGSELLSKDDESSGEVLATIVSTFTKQIIPNLEEEVCWNFFNECLAVDKTIEQRGIQVTVGQSLLDEMAKISTWNQVSTQLSAKIFSVCIRQFNSKVSTAARSLLVSVIKFEDKTVLDELNIIWGDEFSSAGGRVGGRGKFSLIYGSNEADPEDQTRWLKTTFLLEILERVISSSSTNLSSLIQPMFILLKRCVDLDLEESSYRMSLILTVLLKLLQSLTDPQLKQLEAATLDPELLVHCIRSSPSPETRQAALLALARVAITTPDCVLHNSITIFTFMGSHLLKIDSQRSFQVACEAIEIIVPAVKAACESTGNANSGKQLLETNLSIINTFVDASQDMPAHRYNEFLFRLIHCLGEKEYLWIASLLVVKASATKKTKRKASQERDMSNQRLVDLICRYTPRSGLETALRILVNLRNDSPAVRKMFGLKERKPGSEEPDEWDVLRLRSLLFISHLLSSSAFQRHLSSDLEDEMVVQILNLLLEAAILSIETYEALTSAPAKLQRSLVTQTERVLEHCLGLLPSEVFFHLLGKLISSTLPSVRRRALEVVTGKLSSANKGMDSDSLSSLVEPMVKLSISEENAHIQQLALMTLRQLTRQVPSSSLSPAASAFTPSFLSSITNCNVLGSAIISIAEVLNCLGALAVAYVPPFTAWLLSRLDDMMEKLVAPEDDDKETIIVSSSVILGLQKLLESFSGFMNPSVSRLVVATCKMSANPTVAPRVKGLAACLSKHIQPHTLLPLAKNLLESVWNDESAATTLVDILADSAKTLEKNQLGAVSKQYVDFFMFAFTYREKQEKTRDQDVIQTVEQKIIDSFLSVTLRLSLEDFRPILYRVMNAQFLSRKSSHLTTLFHVVHNVASRLKSLFSFALDVVVSQATTVLSSEDEKPLNLVKASLTALTTALTYNKVEGLTTSQYEQLVAALLVTYNASEVPVEELAECLAQLAAATEDDTNWKHLNYQVLLSLRAGRVEVRVAVLEVLEKFVTSRSDTYLAVLPDAVPFMAELLEDDDQVVENKCRSLIQHMEATFGQNIESYFV